LGDDTFCRWIIDIEGLPSLRVHELSVDVHLVGSDFGFAGLAPRGSGAGHRLPLRLCLPFVFSGGLYESTTKPSPWSPEKGSPRRHGRHGGIHGGKQNCCFSPCALRALRVSVVK